MLNDAARCCQTWGFEPWLPNGRGLPLNYDRGQCATKHSSSTGWGPQLDIPQNLRLTIILNHVLHHHYWHLCHFDPFWASALFIHPYHSSIHIICEESWSHRPAWGSDWVLPDWSILKKIMTGILLFLHTRLPGASIADHHSFWLNLGDVRIVDGGHMGLSEHE